MRLLLLPSLLLLLSLLESAGGASLPALANARGFFRPLGFSNPKTFRQTSKQKGTDLVPRQAGFQGVDGVALPLVRIEKNQTLTIQHPALNAIRSLPGPICVLGMTGTARDGKSSFLNMYSTWVRTNWPTSVKTEASAFQVGHDLDTCTEGAWIRTFRSEDGQPFPGTPCASVALVDTQGLAKGNKLGLARVFTLALLMSSTVTLNVMRQFNDDALEKLGATTAAARRLLPAEPFGGDSPNLLVLLRDARLRLLKGGRSVSADTMLYQALQPTGDTLDSTRAAVRAFFNNMTMHEMKQPDEDDLDAMASGELPLAHKPFGASLSAAIMRTSEGLRPKTVGGVPLDGDLLASAIEGVVHQINTNPEEETLSLHAAVAQVLRDQAEAAVQAARRVFRMKLDEKLPTVPHAEELPSGVQGVRRGAQRRRRQTRPQEQEAASSAAPISPILGAVSAVSAASLDLALRNATSSALETFLELAPGFGGSSGSSWLQPYIDRLRESLVAEQHIYRQEHTHATRLASVTRRLRAESDMRQEELRRIHEEEVRQKQQLARRERLSELAGNVALLAMGAGSMLLPPSMLSKVAPIVHKAPTVFAMLGVYRVAQRSLTKMAKVAVEGAQRIWGPVHESAASDEEDLAYAH